MLPTRIRLLGIFPAGFFVYLCVAYFRADKPGEILWLCNMCNLMLAVGLFFSFERVIRASTLLLIIGLPIWIWDTIQFGSCPFHAYLTHIGSTAVGLWSLQYLKGTEKVWWLALGFLGLLTLVSRFVTDPTLNVNVSHDVYAGLESVISSYPLYVVVNTILFAIGLFATELVMNRLVGRVLRKGA